MNFTGALPAGLTTLFLTADKGLLTGYPIIIHGILWYLCSVYCLGDSRCSWGVQSHKGIDSQTALGENTLIPVCCGRARPCECRIHMNKKKLMAHKHLLYSFTPVNFWERKQGGESLFLSELLEKIDEKIDWECYIITIQSIIKIMTDGIFFILGKKIESTGLSTHCISSSCLLSDFAELPLFFWNQMQLSSFSVWITIQLFLWIILPCA